MGKLIFNGGKSTTKKLSKVQKSIDKFLTKHSGNLSKHNHSKLRKLFKKRAKALSNATGMKIHSLFD